MKILHLTTYDVRGGAALCAYRLHRGMVRREDCSSRMLVFEKFSKEQTVATYQPSMALGDRLSRRWERKRVQDDYVAYNEALRQVELFSDDRGEWMDNFASQLEGYDIIQLHWIARFINYRRFFAAVPERVPLVWCLHDKNAFTGGCHYDGGCRRFVESCGSCPQLQSVEERDLSRAVWERKNAALRQLPDDRIHIVANNQWMAKQARDSSLLGRFECTVIPNGVDLDEFLPVPAQAARAALGIPEGKKVIAFVAESANNVRKGFRVLLNALGCLAHRRDLFLLVAGEAHQLKDVGVPCLQVGHVQSIPFLRQLYSAAHVFVIPSLEDNQPSTVMEAMSCGCPVVGFKLDGVPEIVDEGRTGLLAAKGNVQEMARAIEFLLDHDSEREGMGRQARRWAEEVFTRNGQVEKYLDLYRRLLARRLEAGGRN